MEALLLYYLLLMGLNGYVGGVCVLLHQGGPELNAQSFDFSAEVHSLERDKRMRSTDRPRGISATVFSQLPQSAQFDVPAGYE